MWHVALMNSSAAFTSGRRACAASSAGNAAAPWSTSMRCISPTIAMSLCVRYLDTSCDVYLRTMCV